MLWRFLLFVPLELNFKLRGRKEKAFENDSLLRKKKDAKIIFFVNALQFYSARQIRLNKKTNLLG